MSRATWPSRTISQHSRRALRIEELESRALLSAVAYTDVTAVSKQSTTPLVDPGFTPAVIRQYYGVNKIAYDGTGTTIAIVDAYDEPTLANDLTVFDSQFGLPAANLTVVNQNGQSTHAGLDPAGPGGWGVEIALDVEWAHAMAPGASILLVEAADDTMANLMTAENYARQQPGVVAVSCSWGAAEYSGESAYDSYFTTPSGHTAETFLVATGDTGSPVGYPDASPNVVAVGGTQLNQNTAGVITSETGWTYSTGGISLYEAQPSWQKGVVTQSATQRTEPDVSWNAVNYNVYDSYDFGSGSTTAWELVDGTSAACPQWAAMVALADAGRLLNGKTAMDGVSYTLPTLYSAKTMADFNDITVGTSISSSGGPSYTCGVGYDLVTGIGSPKANLVVGDLIGLLSVAANAGGPYSIAEGAGQGSIPALTLNAGASTDPNAGGTITTYQWQFNNDGRYDVVSTSATVTVPWSTLYADGITTYSTAGASFAVKVFEIDSLGATGTAASTITVSDSAPTISPTANATASANTPFTLNYSLLDYGNDPVSSWVVNWGDGNTQTFAGSSGAAWNNAAGRQQGIQASGSWSHIYSQGSQNYVITVSAAEADGTYYAGSPSTTSSPGQQVKVAVTEARPSIYGAEPGTAVANYLTVFGVNYYDTGTHAVSWSWGDGSSAAAVMVTDPSNGRGSGIDSAVGAHTYAKTGTYGVTVTVTPLGTGGAGTYSGGNLGAAGAVSYSFSVTVAANYGLTSDPLYPTDPTKKALVVLGSSANDTIIVGAPNADGSLPLSYDGKATLASGQGYAGVSDIIIYGGGGNDTITVSSKVLTPAWLIGGAGNDTLSGGGGRNLIYSGGGSDHLYGGSASDLIIAGVSTGPNGIASNPFALAAVMAEWESSDSFLLRMSYLGGAAGGKNQMFGTSYYLNNSTLAADTTGLDVVDGFGGGDAIFGNFSGAGLSTSMLATFAGDDLLQI